MACCDQPSMGSAGAGLESLTGDFGPPCPTPAILRSECTRRTRVGGTPRFLSVHCRRGFGRRRRCARTLPGRFMPHRKLAKSRPLIDSVGVVRRAIRSGAMRSALVPSNIAHDEALEVRDAVPTTLVRWDWAY